MADEKVITIAEDGVGVIDNDFGPDGRSKVVTELWQTLSGLQARGTFACSGQVNIALPGKNSYILRGLVVNYLFFSSKILYNLWLIFLANYLRAAVPTNP